MMCNDCKKAGELLKEGKVAEAEAMHCDDEKCTCQHRTDANIINQERVGQNG